MNMTTVHDNDDKHAAEESGHNDPRTMHARKFRRYRTEDGIPVEVLYKMLREQSADGRDAAKTPWALIFTAVGSALAVIFTALTYMSSNTQDKVDRGTAPLNVQISEMDKRITGRLDSNDKVLEKVNARLDSIDGRLSTIELRLERIDSKLTK